MKFRNKPQQLITFLAAAVATLACAPVHAVTVVTDFSSFRQTGNLLGGSNTRIQTFAATTGTGTNTITITNASGAGAGQEAFLSNSLSITAVGDRISVKFGTPNFGTPTSTSSAFGLAIASSADITSRVNSLFFYWRRNVGGTSSQLAYFTSNGDGQNTNASTVTFSSLGFTPDGIFIERTSTGYDLGWIEGANEGIAYSLPFDDGVNNTRVTADGSAVGVYADGRNDNYQYVLNDFAVSAPGSSLPLIIRPATPPATGFDLEWESQVGKLYNLRTSTDLADPIADWDLIEGDIAATPPANVMNVSEDGPRRFYAVEEDDAPPPPPLLAEDFEDDNGGFTTSAEAGTAWEWGTPGSSGIGGSVTTGNDGSTKCWGTNIGNPGYFASPTTNSRLISPAIDLTSVAAATLSFAHAIDINTPGGDTAVLRIVNADTEAIIQSIPFTDDNLTSAAWQDAGPVSLPVGAPIRIEWVLNGIGSTDYMGWYIDDVVVQETTP